MKSGIVTILSLAFLLILAAKRGCNNTNYSSSFECSPTKEMDKNIIYLAKDPEFNIQLEAVDTTKISIEDWIKQNRSK